MPRAILENIFLISDILLLTVAKFEKLGKYFPYCTRHHTITTTYSKLHFYGQIDYITSPYGFPIPNLRPFIFTKFWNIPSKEAHFFKKNCFIAIFIHFRSKRIIQGLNISGFILPYSNFLKRVLSAFFLTFNGICHLKMLFYGIKSM